MKEQKLYNGGIDVERLSYLPEVNGAKRHVEKFYKDMGIDVDTRLMDYHGQKCMSCGKEFNVFKGIVSKVKTVDAVVKEDGVDEEGKPVNKAYIYPICFACTKVDSKYKTDDKVETMRKKIDEVLGVQE